MIASSVSGTKSTNLAKVLGHGASAKSRWTTSLLSGGSTKLGTGNGGGGGGGPSHASGGTSPVSLVVGTPSVPPVGVVVDNDVVELVLVPAVSEVVVPSSGQPIDRAASVRLVNVRHLFTLCIAEHLHTVVYGLLKRISIAP